jgi:LuxR family transcriptional activator of bioluminescence operon
MIELEAISLHPKVKDNVQHATSLLRNVDSLPKLYDALERLASYFYLDNFFFVANYPASIGATTILISNLPKRWCELYERLNYIQIDPAALHCRARVTPTLWWTESYFEAPSRNPQTITFIEEARSFGLRSGVSFPIHGLGGAWGMLSLSCEQELESSQPRLERSMPYNQLLSGYVFEAATRAVEPKRSLMNDQGLTEREKECLVWCSEGKTSWEISKILGISERTVFFHMQNASRKLGASNRIQAVTRAMPHINWAVVRHSSPRRVIRMWDRDQCVEEVDNAT